MKDKPNQNGPLLLNGKKPRLNHVSVAHLFADVCSVSWDGLAAKFLWLENKKIFRSITEQTTKRMLTDLIHCWAECEKISVGDLDVTDAKLRSILEAVKNYYPAPLATDQALLPVENGVVRFGVRKASLIRHNPKYGFRNATPIAYDSRATCPRFEEMVRRVLPDDDDRRVLQMYLGGPLTGLNQTLRMLLVRGRSGTSKTTLLAIQEAILGAYWVADLRAGLLESRFEKSHLLHKRQLSAKDVTANFLKTQGAKSLKHLVGGDGTQAEVKFAGKVSLHGNHFVIITSNGELRLALEGDDEAWMERLIVLDFGGDEPMKKIGNYADLLLKEEGPGILRWLVDGGMMYLQEVRKHGDIMLNAAQKLRVENLVLASKSLEMFVSSKVGYIEGQDTTSDELSRAYATFCKQRGWEPVSSHVLYARLPDLMLHKHGATKASDIKREGTKHRGYRNVILLPR